MAEGWNCCIQGLNSATSPPHSKFIDLDLSSDLTHEPDMEHLPLFLLPFPPYETESCGPPTPAASPHDIRSLSTELKGPRYFIQVNAKEKHWGTKMHILSFSVRQFNIHTAVIPSHVHGKEDLSLFLWVPFDLAPARKTSTPAQTLIFAQHMYMHFTVLSTNSPLIFLYKTHKHIQQHALNSTTSILSKIRNWIGLNIKRSSLAAAQESDVQEK